MGDASVGCGGESVHVIVRLRPEENATTSPGAGTTGPATSNGGPGGRLTADGQVLAGSCILSIGDKKLTIVDPDKFSSSCSGRSKRNSSTESKQAHDFAFDRVFGPSATQTEVFETVKPLVHATVEGKLLICEGKKSCLICVRI